VRADGRLALHANQGDHEYTVTYPHAFPAAPAAVVDGSLEDPDTRAHFADAPLPAGARAIDRLLHDRPMDYIRLAPRFDVLSPEEWAHLGEGRGGELRMGVGLSGSIALLATLGLTGASNSEILTRSARDLRSTFPVPVQGWWVRGDPPDWSDDNETLFRHITSLIARFRGKPVDLMRTGLHMVIGALAYQTPARPDVTQWLFVKRSADGQPVLGQVIEHSSLEFRRRAPFADRLREKSVAIVGCGALGWSIALSLARSGVGRFALYDLDRVRAGNLPRLPTVLTAVGSYKTDVLADDIRRIWPGTEVTAHGGFVGETLGARSLIDDGVDLILDATADSGSPSETNLAAVASARPALYAWTTGGVLKARLFRVVPGRTPCYACLRSSGVTPLNPERRLGRWNEQFVWNGANFNLEMVAAAATRMAVRTLLGNPVSADNADHLVLELGGPVPIARALEYARDHRCEVCS
jgi:molybdopterin/thiamine biosynthesis adenylyltransferase